VSRIRQHLRSNIVGYIALFFALSTGSAVALNGSNTVQSDDLGPGAQVMAPDVAANAVDGPDVVNNSLTGADVANLGTGDVADNSLGSADLAPNSVGSSEVTNNSLSGADINESGLGIVPNADQLDGIDSSELLGSGVKRLIYEADATAEPAPITDLATVGPFTLKAQCEDRSGLRVLQLFVNNPGTDSDVASAGYRVISNENPNGTGGTASDEFFTRNLPPDTNNSIVFLDASAPEKRRAYGTVMIVTNESGERDFLQVDLHAVVEGTNLSFEGPCRLVGTATRGT
jgi:hypothetical protein